MRLMYTVVLDKIQSLYQGRPAALQYHDCQVPITFMDEYEELEHWTPFAYNRTAEYKGSPSYSVSTFSQVCKLCIVLNRVLNQVYNVKGGTEHSAVLLQDLGSLEADLTLWSQSLPHHLQVTLGPGMSATIAPPPHVLSLAYVPHHLYPSYQRTTNIASSLA